MDKSVEVVKREALAAVLSAAREMLRQVVVPAATGKVENLAGLEAAYVELSGALERWDEALEDQVVRFVQEVMTAKVVTRHYEPTESIVPVLEAFTCRCSAPDADALDVCRVCGSFVPEVPAQRAA